MSIPDVDTAFVTLTWRLTAAPAAARGTVDGLIEMAVGATA